MLNRKVGFMSSTRKSWYISCN